MKSEIVHTLTATFEGHAQQTEAGVEYWLARDLQHLLGYAEWRNFLTVIGKAKTACELSGHAVPDHFVDVNKMVALGSGSQRRADGLELNGGLSDSKPSHSDAIESAGLFGYSSTYIRPMAVRPLDHPEREPTPWGFLFLGSKATVRTSLKRRSS
jgi:hypothetical protein